MAGTTKDIPTVSRNVKNKYRNIIIMKKNFSLLLIILKNRLILVNI